MFDPVPESKLPSAFVELEPFAETWCLATEPERWQARLTTPMAGLHQFYDAFTPRFEEAIDHCDKFPLEDLPDDALNLLHLVYSMIIVSMAIEVFGTQKPADSADAVIDRVGAPRAMNLMKGGPRAC